MPHGFPAITNVGHLSWFAGSRTLKHRDRSAATLKQPRDEPLTVLAPHGPVGAQRDFSTGVLPAHDARFTSTHSFQCPVPIRATRRRLRPCELKGGKLLLQGEPASPAATEQGPPQRGLPPPHPLGAERIDSRLRWAKGPLLIPRRLFKIPHVTICLIVPRERSSSVLPAPTCPFEPSCEGSPCMRTPQEDFQKPCPFPCPL